MTIKIAKERQKGENAVDTSKYKRKLPSISVVFVTYVFLTGSLITYLTWSPAYFGGISSISTLSKWVLESKAVEASNSILSALTIPVRVIDKVEIDSVSGLVLNSTSTEARQNTVSYLGNYASLINNGASSNPFIRFIFAVEFFNRTNSTSLEFSHLDGIHTVPGLNALLEPYNETDTHFEIAPFLSTSKSGSDGKANYSDFAVYPDSWQINYDRPIHTYLIKTLAWPGMASCNQPSGKIWFGPYSSSNPREKTIDLSYARCKSGDNGRVIVTGCGISLSNFGRFLAQAVSSEVDAIDRMIDGVAIFDSSFHLIALSSLQETGHYASVSGGWKLVDSLKFGEVENDVLRNGLEKIAADFSDGAALIKKVSTETLVEDFEYSQNQYMLAVKYLEIADLPDTWFIMAITNKGHHMRDLISYQPLSLTTWIILTVVNILLSIVLSMMVALPVTRLCQKMTRITEIDATEAQNIYVKSTRSPLLYEVWLLEKSFDHVLENFEKQRQFQVDMARWKDFSLERISHVAHEIRNPLNGILGLAQVGVDCTAPPTLSDYQDSMNTILNMSRMLSDVLNDTIDISRINSQKLVVRREPVKIDSIIKKISKLFTKHFTEKNLECVHRVDSNLNTFYSDPSRLSQILSNFISNAVKFTSKGTITISANLENQITAVSASPSRSTSPAPIILASSPSHVRDEMQEPDYPLVEFTRSESSKFPKHFVRVEVTDTGRGISDEDQANLFQPFFQTMGSGQLSMESGFNTTGAGLGLVLTNRLVELMGGEIGVRSKEGEGSTFWFTLPYCEVEEGAMMHVGSSPASSGIIDLSSLQLKVLVVDDSPVNRKITVKMLSGIGITCYQAENGQKCVDFVEKNKAELDAIFLDLEMPVMDGWEAAMHIREVLKLSLPIIALSGRTSAEDIRSCISAGFTDHIAKPIQKNELFNKIYVHLKLKSKGFEFHISTPFVSPLLPSVSFESELAAVTTLVTNTSEVKSSPPRLNGLDEIGFRKV